MIPQLLRISGFLSYRDPVELDFNTFDLACISGHNGAGKSSLLDAITWALFGEARGKSNDVINLNVDIKAAEVSLTFRHEGNGYRVQRTLPRGKSTVLEFQILDDRMPNSANPHPNPLPKGEGGTWKPLTEKTIRETQTRIEQTLRLDYDTFINASFFLQGKADLFTQQNAGRRKEVLSNILGLEMWEAYKNRAAEKRKGIESLVEEIDGRVAEIDAELSEEETRRVRLAELEADLNQLASTRAAQESVLENIKRNAALLNEQRTLTAALLASLERAQSAHASLTSRLAERQTERDAYADLVDRSKDIEAGYKTWQKTRKELEEWEKVASEFHEHQKERAPLQEKIAVEKAKLEQELEGLQEQSSVIGNQLLVLGNLSAEIENAKQALARTEIDLKERDKYIGQAQSARERQAELKAENDALKADMGQIKERIDSLKVARGAECPLCGQELTPEHRKTTLEKLEGEGREKGDRFRSNKAETDTLRDEITRYENQITKLASAENDRVKFAGENSQLTERLDTLKTLGKDWESTGRKRLKEVEKLLETSKFAADEQKQLAKLDKELAKLGYDASAHDKAREKESDLRSVEEEFASLRSAKEVIKQIEGELANLQSEIDRRKSETSRLETDYNTARNNLGSAEAQVPDLDTAERELFKLREEENKARSELGGAQQRVDILKTQRSRKAGFIKERDEFQKQIAQHKTLERAFGKDGVPALLIEQALPLIEEKANELLDRLSDGNMSIRFVTQAEYKDKKRDDLKETLDIQISDSAGVRNYEMYSGGEAFRVNFAIRLALSEILAQRKGARLQTLVIDEGFGSQDAQGRQRLIEAINLVKNDFAKILIITHLDELKDTFPTRIEVEKTERGSTVKVTQ